MTDLDHVALMMDRAEVNYVIEHVTKAQAWRGWPESCRLLTVKRPGDDWCELVFTREGEFFGINAYAGPANG